MKGNDGQITEARSSWLAQILTTKLYAPPMRANGSLEGRHARGDNGKHYKIKRGTF
jgi:hypothetical protein